MIRYCQLKWVMAMIGGIFACVSLIGFAAEPPPEDTLTLDQALSYCQW